MVAPLIGLTGRRLDGGGMAGAVRAWHGVDLDVHVHAYSREVMAAGGIPVQLPLGIDAEVVVERLDGLILTGGADLDPSRYAELPESTTGPIEPDRDRHEAALLEAARARHLPVLGVCRGCQLVNVHLGGSLVQHVPDHARWHEHAGELAHQVHLVEGSRINEMYGPSAWVNTLHHQTLARIGKGLVVSARSDDGIAEAIEHRQESIIGVQWHPELLAGPQPLFRWIVDAATA